MDLPRAVVADHGRLLVDAEDDRPARRLERDERGQRFRPRVVVRHDRGAATKPRPGRQRSGHGTTRAPGIEQVTGEDHRPGRTTGKDGAARMGRDRAPGRPRNPPARRRGTPACRPTGRRGPPRRSPARRPHRRRRHGPDEHGLDLGAELAEVGDAHRRPALEDVLAIGKRGSRQDHDARPAATGRREQPGIEIGHRGKEFSSADERHGSGHGGESMRH